MANIAVGITLGVGTLASLGLAVTGIVLAKKSSPKEKLDVLETSIKTLARKIEEIQNDTISKDLLESVQSEFKQRLRQVEGDIRAVTEEQNHALDRKIEATKSSLTETLEYIQRLKTILDRIDTDDILLLIPGHQDLFDRLARASNRMDEMQEEIENIRRERLGFFGG